MKRRDFIALIGGAAVCWPLTARAQQQVAKPRAVGFIGPSTASADVTRRAAFAKRLGELGWVEGRSVAIQYRWAEGVVARAGEIATEYAQQKVDVIVVSGDAQVLAAKRATADIPIVIAAAARIADFRRNNAPLHAHRLCGCAPDVRGVFVRRRRAQTGGGTGKSCQNSLLAGRMLHCRVQRTTACNDD